jgi:glycosyltransferase involved in cell wall biosynthesis
MYPEHTNQCFPNVLHKRKDIRFTGTVHDLIPFFGGSQGQYLQRFRGLEKADALIAISGATAQHLIDHLNYPQSRIFIARWGADPTFRPITYPEMPPQHTESESILRAYEDKKRVKVVAAVKQLSEQVPTLKELRPGFIFCLAAPDPRKNPQGVVRAYAKLPKDVRNRHQLVHGSKYNENQKKEFFAMAKAIDPTFEENEILYTEITLTEEQLQMVYQSADVNIMASFFEGFGMPLVEGMASDTLTTAAKTSSTGEIVPVPELQCDPADIDSISKSIAYALDLADNDIVNARRLRNVLLDTVQKTFSWKNCMDVYNEAFDYVSKLPPKRNVDDAEPLGDVKIDRLIGAVYGEWNDENTKYLHQILWTIIHTDDLRHYHPHIHFVTNSVGINFRHDEFFKPYVSIKNAKSHDNKQKYDFVVLLGDTDAEFNAKKVYTKDGVKHNPSLKVATVTLSNIATNIQNIDK